MCAPQLQVIFKLHSILVQSLSWVKHQTIPETSNFELRIQLFRWEAFLFLIKMFKNV